VPAYPRTRTRRTRVPATGTGMRRVGYGFEKKNPSTRARRTRLSAVPAPAVLAARRGCTRPVPAVPADNPLYPIQQVQYRTVIGIPNI
jgi:hypothetical protein